MSTFDTSDILDEIAIIGMACHFPGARNIQEFWQNLCDGKESISFFSDQELLSAGIDPTLLAAPNYVKANAALDGIELFDASFFNYTPREAEILDPQQRFFLECAWEALEDAGYDPDQYKGRIGIYAGSGFNAYFQLNLSTRPDLLNAQNAFLTFISNDKDHLATRTSYKLNLRGPALSIQTACSTSLVATHQACQSLLDGECDMALAGGVSMKIQPKAGYFYQEGGIYSPDGHCRAFDARAQGTIGGSGVGIVVLKRLADALMERDTIYAVIKGSAVNNDGTGKIGYTAPSMRGQAEVIAEALSVARVDPETITYLETHGTATPLGDPIEIAALTEVFRDKTARKEFCAIGSVKTNIGHLDTAAGIAGLIKTALALKHQTLPASLHFERPNPGIDFANSPFYVNTRCTPWEGGTLPRRAGVSSFGIGGTNAHAVLEEAPSVEPSGASRSWQILPLSARTRSGLENMTGRLVEHLKQSPELKLADVAYTLQIGRRSFGERRILVCHDLDDAIHALETRDPQRVFTSSRGVGERSVAFLFPGQGTQYVHMAHEIYQMEPAFRSQVDLCSEILKPHLGLDLRVVLYPDTQQATEEATLLLNTTALAQPALFVIEYALARLWMEWGVYPQAMLGHSLGEYVAACLAGVFSLEDALMLVAARGRMMQSLPGGAMLAVPLSEQEVYPLLDQQLTLAAINGPSRCVVSGPEDAVSELADRLAQNQIACRRLRTSHAFHSTMMEPILASLLEQVRNIKLQPPQIPYLSNLSGTWIREAEALDPDYWARHLRQPVRFAAGARVLLADPMRIFLEVGPGQTLSTLTRRLLDGETDQKVYPSLPHPQERTSDLTGLLNTLGQLWLVGTKVDWLAFSATEQRHRVSLPTYPFERKRHWLAPAQAGEHQTTQQQRIQEPELPGTAIVQQDVTVFAPGKATEKRMSEQLVSALPQLNGNVSALKQLFASLLGIDPVGVDSSATFLALGADSLFLLQASQTISRQFGIKVPFRQLLEEYSTIEALAAYLDTQLLSKTPPAVSPSVPVPMPLPSLEQPPVPAMSPVAVRPAGEVLEKEGRVPETEIAGVIRQQLQIMAQQLDLLRDNRTTGASPSVSASAPVPPLSQETLSVSAPPTFPHSTKEGARVAPPVVTDAGEQVLSLQIDPEVFVPYRPAQKGALYGLNARQQRHIEALIKRFTQRLRGSKQLAQMYRPFLADSRGTAGFSQMLKELAFPLVVQRAEGARVWDVDGNEYVDITMGFGALLFGHSPSFLTTVLEEQVKRGFRLGLQSDYVGKVARLITELTGVERVAFCNSGTEAIMVALRLARAVTGRSKIALFAGSFHGTFDGVLVRGQERGNGVLQAVPLAPGIPESMIEDVIILHFGQSISLDILKNHAHELAAVLVELPQSRRPDLQPTAFLHTLRRITQEADIALIFDEVVSGFRVHPGGAQALFGVQADLVTYGKALGAGVPVGAVAGKAHYMDAIDGGMWQYGDASYPQAPQTFYAGTYFRHPLLMPVLWATLNHIKEHGLQLQQQLDQRTAQIVASINDFFKQMHLPIYTTRFSSFFRFIFPPELKAIDANLFFYHLLEKGVYVSETRSCFLSTAHTDKDFAAVIKAVQETVVELREGGFLFVSPSTDETFLRLPSVDLENQGLSPRASEECRHPLTEAQKELWFMAHLGDDASRAYVESITLRMWGSFDLIALRKAMQELVNRHEALRTTFRPDGTYQCIASALTLDIPLIDFSMGESKEREMWVSQWFAEETRRAFDLEHGPLLRTYVLKLEAECHLLVLVYHHIILDGRSLGLLLQELSVLYTAAHQGVTSHLPQPVPYSEYVRWQEQQQQTPEMLLAEHYWLAQFARPTPPLELPTDRPRPPFKTYTGARESITISASFTRDLKRLSVQQNCTLFTTLLATFDVFLHRLTQQDDLAVAIPAAGQHFMDNAHLIGHCITLLPIRSLLGGNLPFTHYLSSLQKTLLDAYSNQMYSFISLIKALKLVRHPDRMPLVAAMFNLDYAYTPSFPGLEVDAIPSSLASARFDLFMNITQTNGGLLITCDYDADLFEAQTIQRWLGHFQALLQSIVADPEQKVLSLPWLTGPEMQRVLIDWNDTRQVYSAERCLHHLIEEQVARTPDRTALIFEGEHLTYSDLDRRANQLAHYLQRLGVKAEVRVGISVQRSVHMLVGLLGILKAGGVYVPLDPFYPEERLAFMLTDAHISVLLTQSDQNVLVQSASVVCLDNDWPVIARESTEQASCIVYPANLAYVIYTSGSTGQPKGVQVPHSAVVNFLISMSERPGLQEQDILLAVTTLSFDIAALELFLPLTVGACIVVLSQDVAVDAMRLAEQIALSGPTVIQATPTSWRLLQDMGWRGSPSLKIFCGGEAFPSKLAGDLMEKCANLWNMYGPTETTIWSAIHHVKVEEGAVPIGHPIANTQIYVLDPLLQPVPPGVLGEIYIGGVGVARGYMGRPDLTAERFVPDSLTQQEGERLYRTGDRGSYQTDGTLKFVGRWDRQVKVRGYRMELGEIEAVLRGHAHVREAVIVLREGPEEDRRLVAYIVAQQRQEVNTLHLRGYLKEKLPGYMIPAAFVVLDALPLTTNGKVDYGTLRQLEQGYLQSDAVYIAPRTEVERIIIAAWQEVLYVEKIGIHDNFFDLGGDSILGIRIIARLNEMGLRLIPRQLFQYQTVADLATVATTAPTVQADQDLITGPVPLTPIQHWFLEQNLQNPQHWNQACFLEVLRPLDPSLLEQAVAALLMHHDALRLRIVQEQTGIKQVSVGIDGDVPFLHIDLASSPEAEQQAAIESMATQLQASLNLAQGPLVRFVLFDLGEKKLGRLLIIIHHLAVDVVSWRILQEDLQTAYKQLSRGEVIHLPPRTTSFRQWACKLAEYAQSPVLRQELDYWLSLGRAQTYRLPLDYPEGREHNTEASARTISVALSADETQMLLEVSRISHAQIHEILLTALALLFTRLTGQRSFRIDLEGHGREDIFDEVDLSRTVGWFTVLVPLVLTPGHASGPAEALRTVKEQLRLIPQGGIGYGLLRYLCADEDVARHLRDYPQAEVVCNYRGRSAQHSAPEALFGSTSGSSGPLHDLQDSRSYILEINGVIADMRLQIFWTYSEHIHRRSTIENLAMDYLEELRSLIVHCQPSTAGGYTLSDYPEAQLSQEEFEALIADLPDAIEEC